MIGKRQPMRVKLRRKKNVPQLTELPESILLTIVSFLSLKEAARTSVLSRRWKYIWTSHPNLLFDTESILGCSVDSNNICTLQTDLDIRPLKSKFAQRVDQIMHQRREGSKIDSLTLYFYLGKEFALHIDQWIRCATKKGVEFLDIDFSNRCGFHTSRLAFEPYELPCEILAAPEKLSSLKYLRLASCNLASHTSSYCLSRSLLSIDLQEVNINSVQLNGLLCNCSCLEGLRLLLCKHLVDLNISGASLQLKHLTVKNCFRLQTIDIQAKNLVKFEYVGHFISFYFREVIQLSEAFLNFTGESRLNGVTYALESFPVDLPLLETLNLLSVAPMKVLKLNNERVFTNIKRLVLTLFPFDDEDELFWLSYVLKAFPRLRTLELNLFSPSFLKQPKQIERTIPECNHSHLTSLELNGFYGNLHEVDLLKFLLYNLGALKTIVVNSSQKLYNGLNDWDCEEVSSWYKARLGSISEWLHAIIPPTIDFYFQ